jgi:hypothetical protein
MSHSLCQSFGMRSANTGCVKQIPPRDRVPSSHNALSCCKHVGSGPFPTYPGRLTSIRLLTREGLAHPEHVETALHQCRVTPAQATRDKGRVVAAYHGQSCVKRRRVPPRVYPFPGHEKCSRIAHLSPHTRFVRLRHQRPGSAILVPGGPRGFPRPVSLCSGRPPLSYLQPNSLCGLDRACI